MCLLRGANHNSGYIQFLNDYYSTIPDKSIIIIIIIIIINLRRFRNTKT